WKELTTLSSDGEAVHNTLSPSCGALPANSRAAAGNSPLHPEPGNQIHGPLRRSLRRLLPIRLWELEPTQPNSSGSGALGRLRQAERRQPALPLGTAGRGRPARVRAHRFPAENRRLLRRVYG